MTTVTICTSFSRRVFLLILTTAASLTGCRSTVTVPLNVPKTYTLPSHEFSRLMIQADTVAASGHFILRPGKFSINTDTILRVEQPTTVNFSLDMSLRDAEDRGDRITLRPVFRDFLLRSDIPLLFSGRKGSFSTSVLRLHHRKDGSQKFQTEWETGRTLARTIAGFLFRRESGQRSSYRTAFGDIIFDEAAVDLKPEFHLALGSVETALTGQTRVLLYDVIIDPETQNSRGRFRADFILDEGHYSSGKGLKIEFSQAEMHTLGTWQVRDEGLTFTLNKAGNRLASENTAILYTTAGRRATVNADRIDFVIEGYHYADEEGAGRFSGSAELNYAAIPTDMGLFTLESARLDGIRLDTETGLRIPESHITGGFITGIAGNNQSTLSLEEMRLRDFALKKGEEIAVLRGQVDCRDIQFDYGDFRVQFKGRSELTFSPAEIPRQEPPLLSVKTQPGLTELIWQNETIIIEESRLEFRVDSWSPPSASLHAALVMPWDKLNTLMQQQIPESRQDSDQKMTEIMRTGLQVLHPLDLFRLHDMRYTTEISGLNKMRIVHEENGMKLSGKIKVIVRFTADKDVITPETGHKDILGKRIPYPYMSTERKRVTLQKIRGYADIETWVHVKSGPLPSLPAEFTLTLQPEYADMNIRDFPDWLEGPIEDIVKRKMKKISLKLKLADMPGWDIEKVNDNITLTSLIVNPEEDGLTIQTGLAFNLSSPSR